MAARKKTTTDFSDRLLRCYASAVHDVLKGMGHGNCVLPPSIKALDPSRKVAGEVYTISGRVDRTLSKHETLLRWARVLSKVPAGKVIVCQPNTHAIALMGELSARALMVKETRGYVVDGACRDTDFILEMGFPVFCTHNTPADIVETWTPDEHMFGEPVTLGTASSFCREKWRLMPSPRPSASSRPRATCGSRSWPAWTPRRPTSNTASSDHDPRYR
jgi:hypothetical protein